MISHQEELIEESIIEELDASQRQNADQVHPDMIDSYEESVEKQRVYKTPQKELNSAKMRVLGAKSSERSLMPSVRAIAAPRIKLIVDNATQTSARHDDENYVQSNLVSASMSPDPRRHAQ